MEVKHQDFSPELKKAEVNELAARRAIDSLFDLLSQSSHYTFVDYNQEDFVQKTDALTAIAEILPVERILQEMLEYIKKAIRNGNPDTKKSACVLMATLASKPKDHKINQYWKPCVPYLLEALQNSDPFVQNAAFFAFEKFPGIWFWADNGDFVDEVEPVLLTCLESLCRTWQSQNDFEVPVHFGNFLACVGAMCGKELASQEPRFVDVLALLLSIIAGSYPLEVRELVLVKAVKLAVRQTDINGKARIALRFQDHLHAFVENNISKEDLSLQCVLLDELMLLETDLRCSDYGECFEPLAIDCLKLISNVLAKISDQEEMESVYRFLRSLHKYSETDVEVIMEKIVDSNLRVLKEKNCGEDSVNESEDDDDFEDEDAGDQLLSNGSDSDDETYHSRDKFGGDKEMACLHLIYLAEHAKLDAFGRFFNVCAARLLETMSHPKGRVRGAAMQALARICYAVSDQERQDVLNIFVPDFVEVILHDENHDAVIGALNAVDYLFANHYGVCENSALVEDIVYTLSKLLESKANCQGLGDEICRIKDDIRGSTSSFRYHVYSYCVKHIIPTMIEEMDPEAATKSLKTLFPLLLSKTVPHCSVVNRKMAIRALGKVVGCLGDKAVDFLEQLIPALVLFCSSADEEVRKNAFSALQNCVLRCKRTLFPYYSEILNVQQTCLLNENDANLTSACTTVAGMIVCTEGSMIAGLNNVLPVILKNLVPITKYRYESLRILIQFFSLLHSAEHCLLREYISLVFDFLLSIVSDETYHALARDGSIRLLLSLKTDFPEDFMRAAQKLSAEALNDLEIQIIS